MPRSLLSITDLSPEELLGLFRRGEDAAGDPMEIRKLLAGRLVAGLFWQPAPRLEAALRAACARSGAAFASGREILGGFPETDLLEAAEAAGAYADILLVRHPLEGAARAAAAATEVPVLNAGDGAREDPVRAVLSLRGLAARRGERAPRAAALCGDLRNNRLAHSLAAGLSSLGTTVLLVPARGGEMPEHRIAGIAGLLGRQPVRFAAQSLKSILDMVDTVVLDPGGSYQHPLFTGLPEAGEEDRRRARAAMENLDLLFVATPRAEDGGPAPAAGREDPAHPWLRDEGRFVFRPFGRPGGRPAGRAPSPGELRGEAAREVPLLAELLGLALGTAPGQAAAGETTGAFEGIRCASLRCVARRDARVLPGFLVARRDPLVLECRFCGIPVRPRFAGSRVEKRYHALASADVRRVHDANLVYFASWQEAEQAGFTAAKRHGPGSGGGGDA
jgi:aspartate carbamoyltransferase catalytic subunit